MEDYQQSFIRLFYWAAFFGQEQLVEMFIEVIGVSPFVPLYQKKNVIDACILGDQYEILKYLIKDSRIDARERLS
jgi:hypothetical protein